MIDIALKQFKKLPLEEAERIFSECEQDSHRIVKKAFHGGEVTIEEMIKLQMLVKGMHSHLRLIRER